MSDEKPLIIYHANCWDGFCAAWVAQRALGPSDLHPAHYGTDPPSVKGREVYVLDFCYPFEQMAEMASASLSLVVLDHHQTARKTLADLEAMFITHNMAGNAKYGEDKSAGRMAWEYFGPGPSDRNKLPWVVAYTEDRDLWRHALPNSQEVNAALRSHPLNLHLWEHSFSGTGEPPPHLIVEGTAIRRREQQIIESHVRHSMLISFLVQPNEAHLVRIANATVLFSEIAGELAKGYPFGATYFDRMDGKRQWSLRSTEEGLDVSEVAKYYGGGGHKHAAGFEERAPYALSAFRE